MRRFVLPTIRQCKDILFYNRQQSQTRCYTVRCISTKPVLVGCHGTDSSRLPKADKLPTVYMAIDRINDLLTRRRGQPSGSGQHRSMAVDAIIEVIDREMRSKDSNILFPLSTQLLQEIAVRDTISTIDVAQISTAILKKYQIIGPFANIDGLPGPVLDQILWMLYKRRCFNRIIRWAKHVLPQSTYVVLCAIYRQQRLDMSKSRRYRPPFRVGETEFVDSFLNASCSRYYPGVSYSHLARLIVERSQTTLDAVYLTKVLQIEMDAVPRSIALPRKLDLWLRYFRSMGVDVTVQTCTALINRFIRHGDLEFAGWIYGRMEEHGTMLLKHGSCVIKAPKPNEVTRTTMAQALCAGKHWQQALNQLLSLRNSNSSALLLQPLVTSLVSSLVDNGQLAWAHKTWTTYGCSNQMLNTPALAKLILGYSRKNDTETALTLFQNICLYEERKRKVIEPTDRLLPEYLSGLFNTVLRSALDREGAGRIDLDILRIGRQYKIRFNADTYNVLFAHLSRISRQRQEQPHKRQIAMTMNDLYLNMVQKYHIWPDDMMLSSLIPMWVYLGRTTVAESHWRHCTRHRSWNKVDQVRHHIRTQARHWDRSTPA